MGRVVSIGAQGFENIIIKNCFYVDKTDFIREWWESEDEVTLITRPRRFGKTLNMNMLECFFSTRYAGRSDLFEGLNIWKNEKYRKMQGTWPVIFISFASVKSGNVEGAKYQIKGEISRVYESYRFILKSATFSENEVELFNRVKPEMQDSAAEVSLKQLCNFISRYYGKKAIVLMDEYDTPMQEAWMSGYWDEIVEFYRNLFNATFKTNPYLERAVMTGITKVSKESIFSDLNNLKVVTTASCLYETCFGFTEQEVFDSLDEMDLANEKSEVKKWYDGFTFGKTPDIYNPWSITNFLDEKRYKTYWASSSSNGLISRLLISAGKDVKLDMEDLLTGKSIEKELDEQIIFSQLNTKKNALWSLMMASGYLRVENYYMDRKSYKEMYELKITNLEVLKMFETMVSDWFYTEDSEYNDFLKAMLRGDLEEMNWYMNEVALSTFSCFDTGNKPSGKSEPERFYHGFVLGLLVDLRERYEVSSNRESGYGRYDICLIPRGDTDPGIVIEFKVFNPRKERDLEDAVRAALKQIDEKKYSAMLESRGIEPERIRRYGFAFEGKKVLIG